ncbi:S1 family peptidase [Actinocrispum wychmicini]|uniref:Trypsin-like peptidase n=1 Tax=Actinocrispum wychmicini TaxID=1213861 RepID=A0A4R2JES0_9PSEU|nr:serine protease [Actinocrispum wychmicini]TCO58191.1 trypsin-like peptidase [Actinocrispum wychmicini]
MIRRVLGTLFAALSVGAMAAAPADAVQAADFTGIVALSNCSGSVVKPPQALDSDPALVMSNGHCVKLMGANEVIRNQSSSRTFTLLSGPNASTLGTLRATKISYATMHGTDVSFYQLNQTYAQIRQRFPQFRPLVLSTTHPTQGAGIQVVSGFWKRIWTCNVDGFVFQLKEDVWTWNDSVRYTAACDTIGGTSGSPVVDGTGKVVAINNTGNEDGQRCTLNNPCEVSQNGQVTVRQGINYSEEIFQISACIGAGNQFTLTLPGCTLPR